jgi:DeoR family transcriptional regulator, suf operon transcriptional repressor
MGLQMQRREVRLSHGKDTRGQLLALLCGGDYTVSQLAREVGLTANAVRGQLARLEVEDLVARRVVRRGVGKPAHEYRLSAAGMLRLSRAYLPLLSCLLTEVREAGGVEAQEALLRAAGRRLAGSQVSGETDLRDRVRSAAALLDELGGVSAVRETNGTFLIEGSCCPLRALVAEHPLTCKALEALLTQAVGARVQEECERGSPTRCRLVVPSE